jgi:hypothetical protein
MPVDSLVENGFFTSEIKSVLLISHDNAHSRRAWLKHVEATGTFGRRTTVADPNSPYLVSRMVPGTADAVACGKAAP